MIILLLLNQPYGASFLGCTHPHREWRRCTAPEWRAHLGLVASTLSGIRVQFGSVWP